jgi:superfamily II DNA or RNA helicase
MVILKVKNRVQLSPIDQIPDTLVKQLKEHLTFINPAWIEHKKLGLSNWKTRRTLSFFRQYKDRLIMPRGFLHHLVCILRDAALEYELDDQRRILQEVNFRFMGNLKGFQEEAVGAMSAWDFGTLAAPTGSGKTVMALALVAQRKQPTLIIVHTKELMDQWVERIVNFLTVPSIEIGRIGGGKQNLGERVTVGMVQTLYKCAAKVAPHFGHLVVDECHRVPSRTFTKAVTAFDTKYMLGLSATPWRRDGLTQLIYWHLGDKVHEVEREGLIEAGAILTAEIIIRETQFCPTCEPSEEYSRMLSELTQDSGRNALIVQDVAREASKGYGVCLILTDRKAHCETLVDLLLQRGVVAQVLTGDLSETERRRLVGDLNEGLVNVLVATGQLLGEGFDCRHLSTLFLATPIKFDGRILQYLGRVLRPASGKVKARVYDYVDPVGVLQNAARARHRVYSK